MVLRKSGDESWGSWNEGVPGQAGHGIAAGYHPAAFVYDARANEMVCPDEQRLPLRTIQERAGGWKLYVYTARTEDCRICAERPPCSPQNAMAKHGRAVPVAVEPAVVERYHAKMAAGAGKAIYKERAPVAEFPHA